MPNSKQDVTADTVMQEVDDTKVEPTFVQREGVKLAYCVGSLIALTTVLIFVLLFFKYPPLPSTNSLNGAVTPSDTLTVHKELSQLAISNAKELFTTVVVSALLPVFTAILGYIFGRSGAEDGNR